MIFSEFCCDFSVGFTYYLEKISVRDLAVSYSCMVCLIVDVEFELKKIKLILLSPIIKAWVL